MISRPGGDRGSILVADRGRGGCAGTVLRHGPLELDMSGMTSAWLTQAIARSFDLDDDGVVKQPIEPRAVATTGSPKTSPHSAKPRLEVRIMAPRS